MTSLPDYRPKQLSLDPLEAEILNIIWELGAVSVKDIHERILTDPDRKLAYTSVTTVLRRITQKGWLACDKEECSFYWRAMVTKQQAQALKVHDHLQRFLAVSNPDIVAAFADSLDYASIEQLKAIAQRIDAAHKAREKQ